MFFTTWSFILVLYANLTHKYIDLHFLTTFVLVVSTLIFFVHPGFMQFPIADGMYYKPTLVQKAVYHVIFHILPFAFIAYFYRNSRSSDNARLNAIIMIVIYVCTINVELVYHVKSQYMLFYTILAIIIMYIRTY